MRLSDEMPMDPDVLAELEVIDLTLAGEPIDPAYAELAELALILAAERAEPSRGLARALDLRVERRFAGGPARRPSPPEESGQRRSRARRLLRTPAFGAGLAAVVAALVVAVVVVRGSGSPTGLSSPAVPAKVTAGAGAVVHAPATSTTSGALPKRADSQASSSANVTSSGGASSPATTTPSASYGVLESAGTPLPSSAGRKVVQSARLTLTSGGSRIDAVSQELFDVVAQEHGVVESSQIVTNSGSHGGGSASFSLSIPTANLEATLASLSSLRYAHVVSRSDASQDVTNTYRADQRHLQDAEALRTSLLKQLAGATTQVQVDSLQAQLRDAEKQISVDQRVLSALEHRVSYSSLNVTVNGGAVLAGRHGSQGLTLGRAAHDAGRVLVVAAGVILIGAAALLPIALLLALLAWIVEWVRRRRREQALDQA